MNQLVALLLIFFIQGIWRNVLLHVLLPLLLLLLLIFSVWKWEVQYKHKRCRQGGYCCL
jgi:hypothetical protein